MRRRFYRAAWLAAAILTAPACGSDDATGGSSTDLGAPDTGAVGGDADAAPATSDDGLGPDRDIPTAADASGETTGSDAPAPGDATGGQDTAGSPDSTVAPTDPGPPAPRCVDGEACDDGDPCTMADVCDAGRCEGERYRCNDGQSCTHDLCDGSGGCNYPLRTDRCLIDGACYRDGDTDPTNPCMACVSPVSSSSWTPGDGVACDDGDFCTEDDTCVAATCLGLSARDCDDDNFCTADGCDPAGGCTREFIERACSDADPCTIGDRCSNGRCRSGETVVVCDDDNPCTHDACTAAAGCVFTPNTIPCDDGSICTQGDRCQGGDCVPGTRPLPCADTNPCTDDTCHPVVGCLFVANEAPCDDGNPCTDGDACAHKGCLPGPGLPNCNDDDPCTDDDCVPADGGCVSTPSSDEDVACEDGDPCTGPDFCKQGECLPGIQALDCDDDNPCTIDTCEATDGGSPTCKHIPSTDACDDENPCTLDDRCGDGFCQPGDRLQVCATDNPCAVAFCDPDRGGCVIEPRDNTCSDGDACTVGDRCVNSICVPGDKGPRCDDDNPCTTDVCNPARGCVYEPKDGLLCDDGNACTFDDVCEGGHCIGMNNPCEDDNPCTRDICLGGDNCLNEPLDTPECKPEIIVTYPPRGAMLLGPPDEVVVTGSVKSIGSDITQFLLNDAIVTPDADGNFAHPVTPRSGTNILRFVATNGAGGTGKAVRAFMFSHHYYPADAATPVEARVDNGLRIFLGTDVFDDDNTNTVDDFATLLHQAIGAFDINALIPNPLARQGVAWCTATVRASNIRFDGPSIDLKPTNGGLFAEIGITNFSMRINADMSGFLCPSAGGTVSANKIVVGVRYDVGVPEVGVLEVELAETTSIVEGLDIDLDGLLGFLFNWLIDLFSGTITDAIEDLIRDQIVAFAPALSDALQSLSLDTEIALPPLLGSGEPASIRLVAVPGQADFDTLGGIIGLTSTAVTTRGIERTDARGSIARAGCLLGPERPFGFLELHELELGLFDDLLNQLLYSLWYAGTLQFEIGLGDLEGVGDLSMLEQFGIADLHLEVSFLLPPMVTSCTPIANFVFQVGDVHVRAALTLLGAPMVMDAYASASGELLVEVVDGPEGTALAFGVDEIDVVEMEIESVSGPLAEGRFVLGELIEETLLPAVFDGLAGGALASFPLPAFDIGGVSGGLFPPGTTFAITPKQVYRRKGFTVISGDVE